MTRRRAGTPVAVGRWCARLPLDGTRIELRTDGLAERAVISVWPWQRRDDGEALGEDVIQAAQDDCDARGQSTAYRLVAVGDDERDVATYALRTSPEHVDGVEAAGADGLVQQAMRHNEALTRAHLQATAQAMAHMQRVTELALARLGSVEAERQKLQDELAQRSAEAVALAEEDRVAERENRLLELVEQAAPHIMKKLVSGGE